MCAWAAAVWQSFGRITSSLDNADRANTLLIRRFAPHTTLASLINYFHSVPLTRTTRAQAKEDVQPKVSWLVLGYYPCLAKVRLGRTLSYFSRQPEFQDLWSIAFQGSVQAPTVRVSLRNVFVSLESMLRR